MAEPGERFGRTYHYNGTGEWIQIDSDGNIINTETLDAISNGTLTQRGNTIFQVSPWRILWNIPTFKDAMITPTSAGRYLFSNGIDRDRFNQELGPSTVYSAAGSYEYTDYEGNIHQFSIDYMNLTAAGNALYYNPDIFGKGRYMDVPFELVGTDYEAELRARGYMPAEEETAIERSAASYLLRFYRDELEKIVDEHLEEYTTEGIRNAYELAQAIASVTGGDFDVYISRAYDPSK